MWLRDLNARLPVRSCEEAIELLNSLPVDRHGYIELKGLAYFNEHVIGRSLAVLERRVIDPGSVAFDHNSFLRSRMMMYVSQGPPSQSLKVVDDNDVEAIDEYLGGEGGPGGDLLDNSPFGRLSDDDLPKVFELTDGSYQIHGDGNHRVLWALLYNEPIECLVFG